MMASLAILMVIFSASMSIAGNRGWRPHLIRIGNGQGGWKITKVQCQILHTPQRGWTCGFGVVRVDNEEIAIPGTVNPGKNLWYRRW